MTTYLILDGQLRAETDAEVVANLKRKGWQDAPAKPNETAQWQDGAWIVPPAPTYTAEAWLAAQSYTPLRLLTCLDIEAKLAAASKVSPKLASVRQWLDTITLLAAPEPDAQRSDWTASPYSFAEASQEALAVLAHP